MIDRKVSIRVSRVGRNTFIFYLSPFCSDQSQDPRSGASLSTRSKFLLVNLRVTYLKSFEVFPTLRRPARILSSSSTGHCRHRHVLLRADGQDSRGQAGGRARVVAQVRTRVKDRGRHKVPETTPPYIRSGSACPVGNTKFFVPS